MKTSLSYYSGPLSKRHCPENTALPREIALPTDMWNEIFYKAIKGRQDAGKHLATLTSVSKAWSKACNYVKVKLCDELPFECIFYLPRRKKFDFLDSQDLYMLHKLSARTRLCFKKNADEFLLATLFFDRLPPHCIEFLQSHGSEISRLKLNSVMCGQSLNEFLIHLPRLKALELHHVSGSSCAIITKMTQLKMLGMDQTVITKEGFENIYSLPDLERLTLSGIEHDLSSISKLTNLTMLSMGDLNGPIEWLPKLSTLLQLNDLQIYGRCPSSWDSITQLSKLRRFAFNDNFYVFEKIDSEDMFTICQLTNLVELDLNISKLSNEGLNYLSNLTNLKILKIKCEKLPDDKMSYLKSFTHLQLLSIEPWNRSSPK
jgi:hypothetical protein